eukprot:1155354-Pelagomonas_calceolata.AAC.2
MGSTYPRTSKQFERQVSLSKASNILGSCLKGTVPHFPAWLSAKLLTSSPAPPSLHPPLPLHLGAWVECHKAAASSEGSRTWGDKHGGKSRASSSKGQQYLLQELVPGGTAVQREPLALDLLEVRAYAWMMCASAFLASSVAGVSKGWSKGREKQEGRARRGASKGRD